MKYKKTEITKTNAKSFFTIKYCVLTILQGETKLEIMELIFTLRKDLGFWYDEEAP